MYRLLFLFIVIPALLPAQSVNISVQVLQAGTEKPVSGAIFRRPDGSGTVSDADGRVALSVNRNEFFDITVSFLGFHPERIYFQAKKDTALTLTLKETSFFMETVQVNATRESVSEKAMSRTVIDIHGLHEHRGQSLGEALTDVAGIALIQVGPGSTKPVIRGLHSQRIRILNNGVAQEGQQWGGEHAPEIDPFAAAEITVIKGAAGLAYGPGSIGGVILVKPADFRYDGPVQGTAGTGLFTNNRQASGSVELEGNLKKTIAWRLQGSFRKAGDAATPEYRITNSAFTEQHISGAAGVRKEAIEVDVSASLFRTELGVYKGSHIGSTEDLLRAIERGRPLQETDFSYDIAPPKQDVSHFIFSSRFKWQAEEGSFVTATYGWQRNQRQEFDGHRRFSDVGALKPAFDLILSTYTGDVMWHQKPRGDFFWRAGMSGMQQENFREGAFLIPGYLLQNAGAFWIGSFNRGAVGVEGGVRADGFFYHVYPVKSRGIVEQDLDFANVSASVSVLYNFSETTSIGINAGQSWRPPGINELFSDGVHHGTAQFEKGNPALAPEVSRALDVTWKRQTSTSHVEISTYVNSIDGFIYARPLNEPVLTIRGAFPSFQFSQTRAILSGLDLLAEQRFLDRWEIRCTGSFVRGDNLRDREPLLFMPAPRLQSVLHYDRPLSRKREWFAELKITAVARQNRFPAGVDYADPPEGYVLAGAGTGLQIPRGGKMLLLSIRAENLTNRAYRDYQSRYRYFINEPGRNLLVQLSVPF